MCPLLSPSYVFFLLLCCCATSSLLLSTCVVRSWIARGYAFFSVLPTQYTRFCIVEAKKNYVVHRKNGYIFATKKKKKMKKHSRGPFTVFVTNRKKEKSSRNASWLSFHVRFGTVMEKNREKKVKVCGRETHGRKSTMAVICGQLPQAFFLESEWDSYKHLHIFCLVFQKKTKTEVFTKNQVFRTNRNLMLLLTHIYILKNAYLICIIFFELSFTHWILRVTRRSRVFMRSLYRIYNR